MLVSKRGQAHVSETTEVLLLADADNLYFGFICQSQNPAAIVAEHGLEDRDAMRLYKDDVVEVFLDPMRSRDECYQWIVNSHGTIYDATNHRLISTERMIRSPEWNSTAQAAGARGEGGGSGSVLPVRQAGDGQQTPTLTNRGCLTPHEGENGVVFHIDCLKLTVFADVVDVQYMVEMNLIERAALPFEAWLDIGPGVRWSSIFRGPGPVELLVPKTADEMYTIIAIKGEGCAKYGAELLRDLMNAVMDSGHRWHGKRIDLAFDHVGFTPHDVDTASRVSLCIAMRLDILALAIYSNHNRATAGTSGGDLLAHRHRVAVSIIQRLRFLARRFHRSSLPCAILLRTCLCDLIAIKLLDFVAKVNFSQCVYSTRVQ